VAAEGLQRRHPLHELGMAIAEAGERPVWDDSADAGGLDVDGDAPRARNGGEEDSKEQERYAVDNADDVAAAELMAVPLVPPPGDDDGDGNGDDDDDDDGDGDGDGDAVEGWWRHMVRTSGPAAGVDGDAPTAREQGCDDVLEAGVFDSEMIAAIHSCEWAMQAGADGPSAMDQRFPARDRRQRRARGNYRPTAADLFLAFMPMEEFHSMAKHTCFYMRRNKRSKSLLLSVADVMRCVAATLLVGVLGARSLEATWTPKSRSVRSNGFLQNIVSLRKFRAFLQHVHVEKVDPLEPEAATARTCEEPSWKLDKFMRRFTQRCVEFHCPIPVFSADESLFRMCGRTTLRQFNPLKPAKFGLKLYCLCSPRGFLFSTLLHGGTKYREMAALRGAGAVASGAVMYIVRAARLLLHSLAVVVTDRFFTSPRLAHDLWRMARVALLGTVKRNASGLPARATASLTREQGQARGSYSVFRHDATPDKPAQLSLTLWRDKKDWTAKKDNAVPMLSSVPFAFADGLLDEFNSCQRRTQPRPGQPRKFRLRIPQPNLLRMYNTGMCGVDVFDRRLSDTRFRAVVNKWTTRLLMWFFGAAANNAFIAYCDTYGYLAEAESEDFRRPTFPDFVEELAVQLVERANEVEKAAEVETAPAPAPAAASTRDSRLQRVNKDTVAAMRKQVIGNAKYETERSGHKCEQIGSTRRKCVLCPRTVVFGCRACCDKLSGDFGLCRSCFTPFHDSSLNLSRSRTTFVGQRQAPAGGPAAAAASGGGAVDSSSGRKRPASEAPGSASRHHVGPAPKRAHKRSARAPTR